MNWHQYTAMVGSVSPFHSFPNSGLLTNRTSHKGSRYLSDIPGISAALCANSYLQYLQSKPVKEFQPTILKQQSLVTQYEERDRSITSKTGVANYTTDRLLQNSSPSSRHQCQVCRDSASGVHYGVQTCEGCKSFFKRSLQGKGQTFVCAADNKCQVDKKLRRNCAACRLRVCHMVGMKSNGVRKRKLERQDTVEQKICKTEAVNVQLELRGAYIDEIPTNPHPLPMSPVSLASPPSSPSSSSTTTSDRTLSRTLSRPNVDEQSFQTSQSYTKSSINQQEVINYVTDFISKAKEKPTIPFTSEDYQKLDKKLSTETALCNLFQHEIPSVIQWAKNIPGYKALPLEDQVILTRQKCLDLLVMSVVAQSCDSNETNPTINFSLSTSQYEDIIESQTAADTDNKLKETIQATVVTPLKTYAYDTITHVLRVIAHFKSLSTSREELEMLKLLSLTNIDSHLEKNLSQPTLFAELKTAFRNNLLYFCLSKPEKQLRESRYDNLLLSLALVKDVATRLESCMSQQSDTTTILNSLLSAIS